MQCGFEHGEFIAPIQSRETAGGDFLLPDKGDLLQSGERSNEQQYSSISDIISSREAITQEIQTGEWQGILRRQRVSQTTWHLIVIVGDVVLLISLLALVLLLAPRFQPALLSSWYKPDMWHPKLILGCLALVSWSGAARITQAHEFTNISGRLISPLCALFALLLMLMLLMILTYPFIINEVAYFKGLLLYLVLVGPALSAWRIILATIINAPRFRSRTVIIGVNPAAESIAKELCSAKRYTANVLGYISANPGEAAQKDGVPVLGDRVMLRRLVQSDMIDMVIMTIDYKDNPDLFQEAIELAQQGIAVVPMTKVYERTSGKIPVEHIGDQWYAALPSELIISPFYLCWRTFLDIAFGLLGAVSILLLLPILSALIYLDSPGPIFYKQERIGRNGRKFAIYKFRSMHPSAENTGRAQWAVEGDTRVTRTGRILRATHLDELPQVFNVLRGEMSLIGPRPERPEFVSTLEKSIPFYRFRLNVKPGLTGWAQVKYGYGRTDHDALEKLQYDLYYIKHQSFMLDVFIIIKTIAEVLLHRGM